MGIGPSIIGAIVGALVGAAAQAGIEVGMDKEASWMAIAIGLLAGIGAWKAAGAAIHHISYLRGALAALVALGVIFGTTQAISAFRVKQSASSSEAVRPDAGPVKGPEASGDAEEGGEATEEEATDEEATDEEATDEEEATEAPAPVAPSPAPAPISSMGGGEKVAPQAPNPYQFVFIALGVFLAYEFARGHKPPSVGEEATEGQPPADEPPVA